MMSNLPIVVVSGSTVGCMHPNGHDQLLFRADSPRHAQYQAAILRALLADSRLSTNEPGGSPNANQK